MIGSSWAHRLRSLHITPLHVSTTQRSHFRHRLQKEHKTLLLNLMTDLNQGRINYNLHLQKAQRVWVQEIQEQNPYF
jgi:hypothetical protein